VSVGERAAPAARGRTGLLALLGTAFALNVVALLVPFIDVDMALSAVEPYDLLGSVRMMWEEGLLVLAVVIVAFSVLFPFAKLFMLLRLVLLEAPGSRDHRTLRLLERLGKWSMIDVLIVSFILALTNDQVFIDARPRIGIYAFLLAIALSMATSTILSIRWQTAGASQARGGRPPLWSGLLLVAATAGYVAIMVVPFLAIDDWLMSDHDFTCLTFVWAVFDQGAGAVAAFLALALVLLPGVELGLTWRLWLLRRRGRGGGAASSLELLRCWTMLDVFLVALVIFAIEGRSLMTIEIDYGFLILVAVLVSSLWLAAICRRDFAAH